MVLLKVGGFFSCNSFSFSLSCERCVFKEKAGGERQSAYSVEWF